MKVRVVFRDENAINSLPNFLFDDNILKLCDGCVEIECAGSGEPVIPNHLPLILSNGNILSLNVDDVLLTYVDLEDVNG